MSKPIEDYALVGDRHTAALISRAGSVDWMCLPNFDSPACFAALLGDDSHGRWLLAPTEVTETTRSYVEGTVVLQTIHTTASGRVRVTDVMPAEDNRADLIRRIEGLEGTVNMRHEWIVRLGYGKTVPWVRHVADDSDYGGKHALVAVAGPDRFVLRGPRLPAPNDERHVDEFDVGEGETHVFCMAWSPSYTPIPEPLHIEDFIEQAIDESRDWLEDCRPGGNYADAITRSLLVLRTLTHAETGGIVAAPTTSLPEDLGGERNWDYRFCWLRDAALTVEALLSWGFSKRSALWRDWLLRAAAGDPSELQIMYTVDGSREMSERELDHLPGYEGSTPVRVGNAAVGQRQSDVLGELMNALEMLRKEGVEEFDDSWELQRLLLEGLAEDWREKDRGLWEMRGDAHYFTHSRVMIWVALDRGLAAIRDHGLEGPEEYWAELRDRVREEVMTYGFNEEINSFVQHYETEEVDASLLLLPTVGFIEADDPRFVGTVDRIERDLLRDGLVLRYRATAGDDGLAGDEHPFLICCFWLVTAYALMGRTKQAVELFDRLLALRNDVGLLAEEYDVEAGRQMGNFPQAFSHLGLVQAAAVLHDVVGETYGSEQQDAGREAAEEGSSD
ncbi:MAG TPA: glycoside hydrolase family 15 protein [Ornithinimicrobium sp.]|uniref:glycoside hydrolase family 15 protein n=1 Tax=Ornithinimicrobium sp. TaxID=1977084 RepID=UPI002B463778|nr:glycoside hydrolase family 15 protein [Ornithinimicrobium sp.]HKJ11129.1 glycoside hydrolase family 15 protein [Ornithinimicrobium sp.]